MCLLQIPLIYSEDIWFSRNSINLVELRLWKWFALSWVMTILLMMKLLC